jgi:hypothetical protein
MRISEFVTQPNAPLGLAGISSRTPEPTDYVYDESAGDGTFSYVMGNSQSHVVFGVVLTASSRYWRPYHPRRFRGTSDPWVQCRCRQS